MSKPFFLVRFNERVNARSAFVFCIKAVEYVQKAVS